MKALSWNADTNNLSLAEVDEPQIKAPDEVKLRILEVGICGTDREEVHGGRGIPPEKSHELILGHEMLGEVVEVGHLVTHVKPGELAIFTVRRGCGQCPACDKDAYDMCYTEHYTERGIKGIQGFQSEYVIDHQKYLIKVPESLRKCAVLCEPTSVVEKAIDMVQLIQQSRLPNWKQEANPFQGRRVLIAGVGAIGLLAAMVLLLRGAQVWGYDIVEPNSMRPQLLKKMGGNYLCAKECKPEQILKEMKHVDVIFEAAGNTKLDFDLMPVLGTNGAYVFTGVTERNKPVSVDGGSIMLDLVLKNQVYIGSVNAHIRHWEQAIADLEAARKKWNNLPETFITSRFTPEEFKTPFFSRPENEIKSVICWK